MIKAWPRRLPLARGAATRKGGKFGWELKKDLIGAQWKKERMASARSRNEGRKFVFMDGKW
jgi:hypothetical protein